MPHARSRSLHLTPIHRRRTSIVRGLLAGSIALLATSAPAYAQAPGLCALVTAAELQSLLGDQVPAPKATSRGCSWGKSGGGHALMLLTYANLPPQALAGIRRQMEADGNESMDEPTVGTGAASTTASFGAAVIAPKGARMLQLQYYVGHKATAEERQKLRVVAKAVVGRF